MRTSRKDVEKLFELFCNEMGYKIQKGTVYTINALYLDYNPAYGGYVIHQVINENGGVTCPFGYTRQKIQVFYDMLHFARRNKELTDRML